MKLADARAALHPPPHVLREYALLADGERGAVVGPRGEMAWLCFPRWDSDAVFGALIGGLGSFAIAPRGRSVWGGYYEPSSLIWRSRWVTDGGELIECREALALPPDPRRATILRRVMAIEGTAQVSFALHPRGEFGTRPLQALRLEDGCFTGRIGGIHLRLSGAERAAVVSDGHRGKLLTLDLDVEPGGHHDFMLELSVVPFDQPPADPDYRWTETEAGWRRRLPEIQVAVAERDARHAYAVLSGLTTLGGGTVAAATMSLPERAQEGRNYDYRYTWIRDQCFAGLAAAAAGAFPLLDAAVTFVTERLAADGAGMHPAYTARGEPVPSERTLDLPGYPGGTDVVGNHANEQFQLDVFGESLLLFAEALRHDRLPVEGWAAAETAADAIAQRWHEPDAGIWELDPNAWTHSRLICVAGLRAIADRASSGERAAAWLSLADRILADTARSSVHRSGRWQRAPGDERNDAALLLPPLRGALPVDDPRSQLTLDHFLENLTEDGFAYRYRVDQRPLGAAEGAFVLCGFVVAMALHRRGDPVSAARWFERARTACGPPGLLSEEFDVTQRQLRGNLPQAFVHALLLECAALGT
jgi:hypothetical protein